MLCPFKNSAGRARRTASYWLNRGVLLSYWSLLGGLSSIRRAAGLAQPCRAADMEPRGRTAPWGPAGGQVRTGGAEHGPLYRCSGTERTA